MEVSAEGVSEQEPGKPGYTQGAPYARQWKVLRERGPGWVSSPLPGLWFSPREGPSKATPSGRRENPETLSCCTGEVPPFGSKIDSATNLMGDVLVSPPPNAGPFFSGSPVLLSENERQGEKHFRSFPNGTPSLFSPEQLCFKQFA